MRESLNEYTGPGRTSEFERTGYHERNSIAAYQFALNLHRNLVMIAFSIFLLLLRISCL